jgi:hypothetical protein
MIAQQQHTFFVDPYGVVRDMQLAPRERRFACDRNDTYPRPSANFVQYLCMLLSCSNLQFRDVCIASDIYRKNHHKSIVMEILY